LQDEAAAAGRPMVISVQRFNTRALALYNRLGFRQTAKTAVHVMMTWDR
jgi:ribosomal protein S18 acetylase RimI-like enzyme